MEDKDFVGIRNIDTGIGAAGVGYVVVPQDMDRDEYITDCYRTNTLCINGGKGCGYFRDVNTDKTIMQNIQFPTDEENRGTMVVWIRDSVTLLPIIIASLRKQEEYYSLEENQYRLKRENVEKTRYVEIFMDGDKSSLEINILSDEEDEANFDIKLSSKNKNSVFNLSCDNEINFTSENKVRIESNKEVVVEITDKGVMKGSLTYELGKGFDFISEEAINLSVRNSDDEVKMTLSYELGKGLEYKDEYNNEVKCKDGEIDIVSNKINHNEGGEPMVLGDTLKGILKDLISAINKLTVPTALGPSGPPINIAEFSVISAKLGTILSKKSNLD